MQFNKFLVGHELAKIHTRALITNVYLHMLVLVQVYTLAHAIQNFRAN